LRHKLSRNIGLERADAGFDLGIRLRRRKVVAYLGGERDSSLGGEVRAGDTVGGEDRGKTWYNDSLNAEAGGDGTSMLPAGSGYIISRITVTLAGNSPAEAAKVMGRHSKAPLLRHIPHRSTHPLVRNPDETSSDLLDGVRLSTLARRVDLLGELHELLTRRRDIKGLVRVGAKNGGELCRDQTAEDEIGIGDGEVASLAVTGRTGAEMSDSGSSNNTINSLGTDRLRADNEHAVLVCELRPAAPTTSAMIGCPTFEDSRCDGLDGQLRACNFDVRDDTLECELKLA
jgi:hypothetical protein